MRAAAVAMVLVALVSGGCIIDGGGPCASAWSLRFEQDGLFRTLPERAAAADVDWREAQEAPTLPFDHATLDARWGDFALGRVEWTVDEGGAYPTKASLNAWSPGGTVYVVLPADASDATLREVFRAFMANVTEGVPAARLTAWEDALVAQRHPSAFEERTSRVYGHSADVEIDAPLRLEALYDAMLTPDAPGAEGTHIGRLVQEAGAWSWRFELPVRSADVPVDAGVVAVGADPVGQAWARLTPASDVNATQAAAALRAALDRLDAPAPATLAPGALFEEPCGV